MNRAKPFIFGILASVMAILVARRYFPGHEEMATCAFVAVGLGSYLAELLESNRRAIWEKELPASTANRILAYQLISIFIGIFVTALIFQLTRGSAPALELDQVYQNTFGALFYHNLMVLCASACLAFIYRASGLVLVLGWNALAWANAFAFYISATSDKGGIFTALLLGLGLMPHLVLEALSYVIAGMGALFLSKALFKYRLASAEFQQVSSACVVLLLVSLVVLVLAAATEIWVGQPSFHSLRG